MTEKLFYQDPYLRTFSARVLDCRGEADGFFITLDRTAFYPEGGGQPADTGTLGNARVLEVHQREGEILHRCDRGLAPGAVVTGTLDWARRFDHMQQHSGEHIVSGMICAAYGCDNVGFHMGSDVVTIDFNCDLTLEQALEIEARANRYITENHPMEIFYPSPEELAQLPYRSKKALSGEVRLTRFSGADLCACCGTHVAHSGEIGLVQFLSCQKFREGVRLELLCGRRASTYLSGVWQQNLLVSQSLSVKPLETAQGAERMKAELAYSRARSGELETQLFSLRAAAYRGTGNVLLFEPAMPADSVRRLAVAIGETCGGRCAVFSGEDGDFKYAMVAEAEDLRPLCKALNSAFSGRGGGKPGFVQGSVAAAKAALLEFFA